MKNKKVILDTNLWISFLISKQLNFLDDLLDSGKIKLMFSQELIAEFLEVAQRPKFERFFTKNRIEELLRLFDTYGKLVIVTSNLADCRDIKDNFLLNLAVDGKADYLISGDKDLLVIDKIGKTKILRWTDFLDEIESKE